MRSSAILSAILVLAACGKPQAMPQQPPPPQVGVAAAITRELPVMRELTGRIEAVQYVEVRPQVSGSIERVLVRDGAAVAAGEVLLEIDRRPLNAAAERAAANAAQAEANLRLMVSTRDRNQRLLAEKVVAQQIYDDSVTAAQAAEAALAAARATLVSTRLDLDHATVRAPIAGRIGRILASAGNVVQGGGMMPGTLLATLLSVDPVHVVFDLDEATYHRMAERLAGSVAGKAPVPVAIGLAGEEGFPHRGTVTFVDNTVDAASGSIRLRATVPDPQGRLTPGSFARIRLEVTAPRPVVLVNSQAVLAQLATRYVLAVDAKGLTSFRPVTLGPAHGPMREVVAGLQAGEVIVATNLAKVMFPGAPVQGRPVDMETLAEAGPPASKPAESAAKPAEAPAAPAKR